MARPPSQRGTPVQDRPTKVTRAPGSGAGPASGDDQPTAPHDDIGIVAELHAVLGSGARHHIALYHLPDVVLVGRGSMCDWQLEDNSLSRKHANLHWDGTSLVVEDLGSANGTRLGGRRLAGTAPVAPGTTFYIGKVAITLAPPSEGAGRKRNPDQESTDTVPMPDDPYQAALEDLSDGELEPEPPEPATPAPPAPPPQALRGGYRPEVPTRISARSEVLPLTNQETRITAQPSGPAPTPPATEPLPQLQLPPAGAAHAVPVPDGGAVWRPARHYRHPDDVTGPWDPVVVTARPTERLVDVTRFVALVKERWRTQRRVFVLAGATLWVGVLVIALLVHERRQEEEDLADAAAATTAAARRSDGARRKGGSRTSPVVTPLAESSRSRRSAPAPAEAGPTVTALDDEGKAPAAPAATGTAPAAEGGEDPAVPDREAILAEAIANYDLGKTDEALAGFRRLAGLDPDDEASRLMIDLLQQRAAARKGTP